MATIVTIALGTRRGAPVVEELERTGRPSDVSADGFDGHPGARVQLLGPIGLDVAGAFGQQAETEWFAEVAEGQADARG